MMKDINPYELLQLVEEHIEDITFEDLERICFAITIDLQLLKEMYYENPSNRRGLC